MRRVMRIGVKNYGLLASVPDCERRRTAQSAAAGRFDFHDFGTLVGEQHTKHLRRDVVAKFENAVAFQNAGQCLASV